LPERNIVSVAKVALPRDAFAVHVSSVEAPEIAQSETTRPAFDDAVLLRHDLVEQLHGVGRMATEGVMIAQLDHLLTFRGNEQDSGHASQTG
jgi:hypothetical protein